MRTTLEWLKEQRERVWFAATVNLLILGILLLIFRPAFETNDDMGIALFVNGAKGTYDAHLVYSNYLLGLILSVLYQFTGGLPWYSLLQYAVLFLSFTAIFHVVVRKMKSVSAVWISVIVIWIFAYEGYIHIQFTKTAGIISAAGILLLLYAAAQEKAGWKLPACGYLLACFGFMYREHQFLAELALMSGIGLFLLLDGAETRAKELWRRLRRCLLFFGALALLAGCLHVTNSLSYRSLQWKEYFEYNRLRTELLDYGFPDYAENRAEYLALGVNRTALRLYRQWSYADTEKFTPEVMRGLIALKEPKTLGPRFLIDFLKDVPRQFFRRISACCLLVILLYSLYCARHSRSALITVGYEALLGFLLYLALYYKGRYLINRVDVGLCLAGILVLLWVVPSGKGGFSSGLGLVFLCMAVLLPQASWKSAWRISSAEQSGRMREARAALEEITADKEHLYVYKTRTLSFAAAYGVFDTIPFGSAGNVLGLGGWPAFTPGYCSQMEEYGVTNPYRDLIGSDRLYLVDDDIKLTMKYIHKYYDSSAKAVLVSEYPEFQVYRIVSG